MNEDLFENAEPVVELAGVTRRYGTKIALDGVSLTLQKGIVLGVVGENGAGKTTLIKHILGLLKVQSGTVRVFGRDPADDPVGVLSRIGYLSEDCDLPDWMRVHELMRYTESFYAGWDREYAAQLAREFCLDPSARLKTLSKGQRARAGLLAALAHRPDLLVLDEPSSGLDPIVRRDILSAVIRTIADDGRTVLFSSHLLTEVERVSDRIAMIREGSIIFCDTLDHVKEQHRRITLRFETARQAPPTIDGTVAWEGGGREWTGMVVEQSVQIEAAAALLGAEVVEQSRLTLDEIFVVRASSPVREMSEV